MCGIVAHFCSDGEPDNLALVQKLASQLTHRGPDGQGYASLGRVSMGHTRLAIVDLAQGQQPMRGQSNGSLLVCNGEIYNHLALRQALGGRHSFATSCDSEVIVHLYEDLGSDCTHELDGMFAFVASDGESFVAARDPLGIKPLYYGQTPSGAWLFGSEAKVVAQACRTFASLPPGHLLTEEGEPRRWFSPSWLREVGSFTALRRGQLANQLEQAVEKRLMSDVPVGVFLSGGLDSSIVTEIAARYYAGISTFSVGVEGASDLEAARLVAKTLKTRHYERIYGASDVENVLSDVIRHLESYDAALIRSAIPCYFLAQLASEHVKMVLTGEGADELFGGYDYFAKLDSRSAFHHECKRLLLGLHSMNLQRVDRMTMAHGLEARVPFLDVGFVDFAMRIDPLLKMWQPPRAEKGLLRNAFRDRLPSSIIDRPKLEFSRGSGAESPLLALADARVSDRDLARARVTYPVDPPTSKEELLYRRIFNELFPGEVWRANVGRWQPRAATSSSKEVN